MGRRPSVSALCDAAWLSIAFVLREHLVLPLSVFLALAEGLAWCVGHCGDPMHRDEFHPLSFVFSGYSSYCSFAPGPPTVSRSLEA